jgi:hypothetical protein
MTPTTVFVVYWHDRHIDPVISVHQTRVGADSKIDEHKALYDSDDYKWTEENYGRDHGWVRYVSSNDDGPNGRIEVHEVKS